MERLLSEAYVFILLEDGRDFCVPYSSAIGVLEGDFEEIKVAYEIKDLNGALIRGRRVDSKKTLKDIVEGIKLSSEEIMDYIPERFWREYHDCKAVRKLRKAYNSHNINSDVPPIQERYNLRRSDSKKRLAP